MLPQLTVYAKIIYLLMVVISGALCTVEDYVIMSQCAHNKAIHLAAEGTVSVTDISKTQNITIVGLPDYINNDFKITLYAKETQRYLCFNENWKLVGMREIQETCYFNETIVHGYFVFRSVIDLQRRVGFTHRGKAIGPKKNVTDACYLFTKIHAEQFFHQHTQYYAPKTKTNTATAATSTTTRATTTNAAAGTATTNANKSKITRNKYNNNNNNNNKSKTNGMRNNSNSNTNQNRQNNQGHSSNISNTSNSNINLSSIKEQLSVSNSTQQQQQQKRHHQVRHHHNDPNVVARRHQHEHKPKQKQRRQRMRARATASPTTTVNTIAAAATTTAANQLNSQTTTTANRKTAHSNNNKAAKITPITTTATAIHVLPTRMRTATTTITTTTMANKRKGRRRKGDRVHKKQQQKQQQLQQLPANAKDPQHRQANKAQQLTAAEPTSAIRRLWTTTQMEEEDSASAASSYSTADDYTLTSDWSAASFEPAAAATTAEYLAVSPTLTTLASSSTWPADFEASIATISDDNMAAASYATMLNNMLATADTAAASPSDAVTTANDEFFSSTLEAKSTAATTYNIANTWSADATINDDFSTTSLDGEPTPMLSTQNAVDSKMLLALSTAEDDDETATTTTTVSNNSSSSSSDFSSFATEQELLYSESTAETSTTNAEEEDDIFTTNQAQLSSVHTSNVAENVIDTQSNIVAKPYFSSPTAAYANISPTLATMMQHKLLRTTQRLDDATLHEQTVLATDAAMSSSSNTLDDSLTEYVFSTKSNNIHNKNHRNRQQNKKEQQQQQHATSSSTTSSSHRNFSLHGDKNKNAYNSKINRNKLLRKASAGTTAATYLPTSALATFVTQNHRELLYADMLQEEQQLANNNHSLININKNINNHQNNNTLYDYTSSVGFPLNDIAAATTVDAAAATAAAMPTLSSTTTTTTKKHFRKSTQKLMATPFHQLTAYVRNHAGDIDIDNMDNISVYPDLLDVDVVHSNGSSESDVSGNIMNNNNSRMTIVSGYLPTSATATLPESIRIAKIKINKERKRMLRQRFVGGGGGYA